MGDITDAELTAAGSRYVDTAVVVLNYRGWLDTRRCLESLSAIMQCGARVIVVDNGGEHDEAARIRCDFPGVMTVVSDQNLGFSGGNNLGVSEALACGAARILLLNNDMIVLPRILDELLAALENGYGIVGPGVSYMDEPGVRMPTAFAMCPDSDDRVFVPVETIEAAPVCEVDLIMGCAMLIRREVFDSVGLLCERYFLQHEESDYCLAARRRGWRIGTLHNVLARHKGSSSFRREGMARWYYYDTRNYYLLAHRLASWGDRNLAAVVIRRAFRLSRHAYFRSLQEGRGADATAICAGVWHGIVGRFGPGSQSSRVGTSMTGWLLALRADFGTWLVIRYLRLSRSL